MNHFIKISIALIHLCSLSFASEDLTLEKDFRDSYQITKVITKTLELKKQDRIKGQANPEFLLSLALAGETIERISIAYNIHKECKVIMKTKSYSVEFTYPKKGKCMDLYPEF